MDPETPRATNNRLPTIETCLKNESKAFKVLLNKDTVYYETFEHQN